MVSGFTRKRLNAKAQRHKGFGHEFHELTRIGSRDEREGGKGKLFLTQRRKDAEKNPERI